MFLHNLKYSFKTLFKNKTLIFWTFAFPILMGLFFNLAFADITESEKLKVFDIAIINNEEFKNNPVYKNAFDTLSDKSSKDRLFNTKYVSKEEAKKLLKDEKIIGYLELKDGKSNLTFNYNGINQTIFKYVVDEINDASMAVDSMLQTSDSINFQEMYSKIESMMGNNVEIKNTASANLDYMMIEFYTLIAMTCLYGGILSMVSINKVLPNISNKGKRVGVSPAKKSTVILSSLVASLIAQLIGLALLFLFTIFVIKVDYGDNLLLVMLLAFIGSFAGLALGLAVGVNVKASDNAKTGILIAISMAGSFFSGMMGVTMKYIIDKNIPIINKLNPANFITDGLYSLYYYDNLDRYILNVVSLLVFAFILIAISFVNLRRQKYDSI